MGCSRIDLFQSWEFVFLNCRNHENRTRAIFQQNTAVMMNDGKNAHVSKAMFGGLRIKREFKKLHETRHVKHNLFRAYSNKE